MMVSQQGDKDRQPIAECWMRAISFVGLHRILKAVADSPRRGLRAGEINKLVRENKIPLTRSGSTPAPTTLYRYRNTLLHLRALKRDGPILRVNDDDPDVRDLLRQPAPLASDQFLNRRAGDRFVALVLNNQDCRWLFFDLFMPSDTSSDSVSNFRLIGLPVKWTREHSCSSKEIVFCNETTKRTFRYSSPVSVNAILYGLRYWARDELRLIDEYCRGTDGSTIMFPVLQSDSSGRRIDYAALQTARFLLTLRASGEWTLFPISDLIFLCCEERRQPISVLFSAIDWLRREWPHHMILIPTSRALATLTATSPQRDALELRRYYKTSNGSYISHIRIHKDIIIRPVDWTKYHARCPSKS